MALSLMSVISFSGLVQPKKLINLGKTHLLARVRGPCEGEQLDLFVVGHGLADVGAAGTQAHDRTGQIIRLENLPTINIR